MYVERTWSIVVARHAWRFAWLTAALALGQIANGQSTNGVDFHVASPTQRLEMVVNTSRILTLDKEIPQVLVNNQDILRVVPLTPHKIQVSALKPGVTQINLWEKGGDVRSVDVVVFADARQLELVLQAEFPKAAIRVRPLASSVVLTGHVDRPDAVSRIVRIAEDYYPKVINNISVGGVQQVSLHVKVMEVSRTKLRSLGADWAYFNGDDYIIQSAAGLISAAASGPAGVVGTGQDTIQFGIIDGSSKFFGFLDMLRNYDFVKVLAEPTLTTVSGRPASFIEGGEFPVIVPQALGVNAVEFKQFGTRVDFVPIVLGNSHIRLEVRPEVSEVDASRSVELNGVRIPGLRMRRVDTAVEMRSGQTLALAGLIQHRVESSNRGIPVLADIPYAGRLFGRVQDNTNEIELLVIVRPELVAALDPHQVPPVGPGELTTSPNDCEFYQKGFLEVPKCCPEPRCPGPQGSLPPGMEPQYYGPQSSGPQFYESPAPAPANNVYYGNPAAGANFVIQDGRSSVSPQGQSGRGQVAATPGPAAQSGLQLQPAGEVQPQMFGPSGYDKLEF